MWPEVKEGLNWIVRSPYLRRIAACTGTSNFFGTMGFAIFILYALRVLHLQPWEIGLVFAAGSVGAIIGALVVNRIQKRIGVGPAIIAMAVLFSIAGIAVPLAPKSFPLPLLIGSFFVTQFGGVAYNITQVSLRQAITPERLQGRMNAAMRWIVWGTIPLGTLLGGALGQVFTLRTALFVSAIGGIPTFLLVLFSPLRHMHDDARRRHSADRGGGRARRRHRRAAAGRYRACRCRSSRRWRRGDVSSMTRSRRSRSRRPAPRTSRR